MIPVPRIVLVRLAVEGDADGSSGSVIDRCADIPEELEMPGSLDVAASLCRR
jgi:hypothetical protein